MNAPLKQAFTDSLLLVDVELASEGIEKAIADALDLLRNPATRPLWAGEIANLKRASLALDDLITGADQ